MEPKKVSLQLKFTSPYKSAGLDNKERNILSSNSAIFISGYVSLFRVGAANALDFDKVLDKQEGRILCLDWHSDGRHIVTGN